MPQDANTMPRFQIWTSRLAGVYNRQLDQATLDAYWLVLGKFTGDQLDKAFARALEEERYMPTPAAIRSRIDQERRFVIQEGEVPSWTQEQFQEARTLLERLSKIVGNSTESVIGEPSKRRIK